jgi:hypothetical protein
MEKVFCTYEKGSKFCFLFKLGWLGIAPQKTPLETKKNYFKAFKKWRDFQILTNFVIIQKFFFSEIIKNFYFKNHFEISQFAKYRAI